MAQNERKFYRFADREGIREELARELVRGERKKVGHEKTFHNNDRCNDVSGSCDDHG